MPKYDDFGRPIYETAEEYNKAHRTGNTTRIYDSSEGQTYNRKAKIKAYRTSKSTGQYTKRNMSKIVLVVTIGILLYFLAMIVFLMFNVVRSPDGAYEDNWVAMEEDTLNSYSEYLGDDTTPLPEGYETFFYNGQSYSLPMTMEEINHMGFSLEAEYDENYMLPTQYEETLILNDEDGYMIGMVCVSNYTEEVIPLGKAQVNYFYIENPSAYDFNEEGILPDFVFGDGLTFESSYQEVESYFGVPYYHYQDHSEEDCFYDSYEWSYYGEDEIHFVCITFWNGVIADIGIEKRVIEEY